MPSGCNTNEYGFDRVAPLPDRDVSANASRSATVRWPSASNAEHSARQRAVRLPDECVRPVAIEQHIGDARRHGSVGVVHEREPVEHHIGLAVVGDTEHPTGVGLELSWALTDRAVGSESTGLGHADRGTVDRDTAGLRQVVDDRLDLGTVSAARDDEQHEHTTMPRTRSP